MEKHTNKAAGNSELQVVVLGEKRDNSREDRLALNSLFSPSDNAGSDFDLVSEFQYAGQDRTASDASLQIFNLGTRLVDVKRSDDYHVGGGCEISDRDRDLCYERLVDGIDVVFQLSRDRDNWGPVSDGTTDKLQDRHVVFLSGGLTHQVDFILEDDDVVQFHDLYSSQVL